MKFVANTTIFVVIYLVLMVPTYLLPWLGFRLELANFLGGGLVGRGPTPLWWAQAWCLAMLTVIAWVRGNIIDKSHLPVFPFLAAIFDLVPGLKLIPMVPTVMHLLALISGAQSNNSEVKAEPVNGARTAGIVATLIAVGGIALFMSTPKPKHHDPFGSSSIPAIRSTPPAKTTSTGSAATATPPQNTVGVAEMNAAEVPPSVAENKPVKLKRKKAAHSENAASGQKNQKKPDDVEVQYITIN